MLAGDNSFDHGWSVINDMTSSPSVRRGAGLMLDQFASLTAPKSVLARDSGIRLVARARFVYALLSKSRQCRPSFGSGWLPYRPRPIGSHL